MARYCLVQHFLHLFLILILILILILMITFDSSQALPLFVFYTK